MRLPIVVATGLVWLIALATPAVADGVDIRLDRGAYQTVVGDKFSLDTEISNRGLGPSDRMFAHLNVASLSTDVYVDPEDWSSRRTVEVAPIVAGRSVTVSWDLQTVNVGSFDVYVVLLPNGARTAGTGPLVVSPPVHVRVAGRNTLNAGGALPVAVAVPLLLGFAFAATGMRARRTA